MNPYLKPWNWMLAGIFLLGACLALVQFAGSFATATIIVGLLGFFLALAGFSLGSTLLTQKAFSTFQMAGLSLGMAFSLFLGGSCFSPAWDTMSMASHGLSLALILVAICLVLPPLAKKIAISGLILFHFIGISTAVTSLEPPGAAPSYIATNLWAYCFRHYLTFMYLNNAYHFYSPEPGPATLLWFRIQYDDASFRWFKIPNRKESPITMHYQRMLSVTESTNMAAANNPENWEEILQKRNLAGLAHMPQITPLNRTISQSSMYREPSEHSKRMVNSYARYISRKFQHPQDKPNVNIDHIKIYKVTHGIITVQDLARDYDPLDKTMFYPYFLGSFDKTGKMIDPNDPFLYFLLPITRSNNPNEPSVLTDSLEIHAGDQKVAPTQEGGKK